MIKIKKVVEYFQETCDCGKPITGITEKQLKHNMKIHKVFCEKNNIQLKKEVENK